MAGSSKVVSEAKVLQLSDGTELPFVWQKSGRSRHIRVTVTPKGLRVSSPPRAPWLIVKAFLHQQEPWLRSHLGKVMPAAEESQKILFEGKAYDVELARNPKNGERVWFEGKTCFIAPVVANQASITKTFDRWLKTQAAEKLSPVFIEMREKMGIEAQTLKWKETTSRWGSCAAHGAIMLNWRLIHAPPEVSQYVIIHELSHRVHLNHGEKFWRLVEEFDPAYRLNRGWLKRNGHLCVTPAAGSPAS